MPRVSTFPHRALPLALVAAAATIALSPGAATAQTVRSGTGATPGDLLTVVDLFRADLGALNPNTPGSADGGRREINWDGVPTAFSSPNAFPGDFFNANTPGRARGTVFSTPGSGFQVSSNAGEGGFEFENLEPGYPDAFQPFSPQKLFTSLASNVVDVHFFVPGSTTPATVRGFGAVFADVDLASTTSMSFFGLDGGLLGTFFADALDGGLSFLGVSFETSVVSRVRITSGNAAPGVVDGGQVDVVVMDDFIYAEPLAVVPEPGTWLLMCTGLVVLGAVRLRRRRA